MPIIHRTDDLHLLPGQTGDITIHIVGFDEEFQEFCPAGPGSATATICRMIIGLGVVGSLVGQEPNNSVYLAPFGHRRGFKFYSAC